MKQILNEAIIEVLKQMKIKDVVAEVTQTADLAHGDYTTNVALVTAKKLGKKPLDAAEEIAEKLTVLCSQFRSKELGLSTGQRHQTTSNLGENKQLLQDIEKIEVAPPGFINFYLSASSLSNQLNKVLEEKETFGTVKSIQLAIDSKQKTIPEFKKPQTANLKPQTKKIMVEFAHPNTHKAFHIGHLRNIVTGESLVRLLAAQGHAVIRANYQGDVGMHIAKCLYGILQNQKPPSKKQNFSASNKRKSPAEKAVLLGKMYAIGSRAYEDSEEAKKEIQDLNFLIYAAAAKFAQERGLPAASTDYLSFVKNKDRLEEVYQLWKETRQWSLDYFDSIYKRVYSRFDRLYFESECLAGVDLAQEALQKGILQKSDGAIIFDGTTYGLDKRVFVNSMGLPTYEGKELALAKMEFSEFGKIDQVIHVVGPEQTSFFQVTFKVEELLGIIENLDQQKHLIYGWVRLKKGKMSSRLGNVVLGEWLLAEVKKAVYNILQTSESNYNNEEQEEIAETTAVAAVKYSFLKVSTMQEIAFDIAESVNLNGDSGPYLLYTYARCKSVIRRSHISPIRFHIQNKLPLAKSILPLNYEENIVIRLIYRYPEIIATAADNFSPNVLCKYLYDLASAYNTFYKINTVFLAKPKLKSKITNQKSKLNLKRLGQVMPSMIPNWLSIR